jgi:hypothetical protein
MTGLLVCLPWPVQETPNHSNVATHTRRDKRKNAVILRSQIQHYVTTGGYKTTSNTRTKGLTVVDSDRKT